MLKPCTPANPVQKKVKFCCVSTASFCSFVLFHNLPHTLLLISTDIIAD